MYRNIAACKQFAHTVRTAYGPNGMNKMVINHLEKLFVTSDAATIIKELEVEHPAAKLMVLASEMQEAEVGDGTNFVIIFAGALLEAAEELLRLVSQKNGFQSQFLRNRFSVYSKILQQRWRTMDNFVQGDFPEWEKKKNHSLGKFLQTFQNLYLSLKRESENVFYTRFRKLQNLQFRFTAVGSLRLEIDADVKK